MRILRFDTLDALAASAPSPMATTSDAGPPETGRADHRLSVVLSTMAADQRAAVSLGELSAVLGGRVHALALLILVLPETIPAPLPSISLLLGFPLVIVAAHLVLHGDGTALPRRMRELR